MKIYIIRHGQTNWNKKGIIQGQKDIELNETGVKQAEKQIKVFNEKIIDFFPSTSV